MSNDTLPQMLDQISTTELNNIPTSFENISFIGEFSLAHLPQKLPSFGVVYVLKLDNNLVKIGCSTNPAKRIQELEKTIHLFGNLKITHLVLSKECTNYCEVEAQLHQIFDDFRVESEWFKVNLYDVVNAINEITLFSYSPKEMTVVFDEMVIREFDGRPIRQRKVDGYFDATAMCKAAGKRWFDYYRLDTTQAFIHALNPVAGIPATEQDQEVIQTVQGGASDKQGTWIHPYLAINLAQWCSPQFAVQVTKWVFAFLTTGSVHLNSNNSESPSQLDYEKLARRSELIRKLYRNVGLKGKALDYKVNEAIKSETEIDLWDGVQEHLSIQDDTLTPERQKIIDCIKNGITHYTDIAKALGKRSGTIRKMLSRMKDAGEIISLSKGEYGLVDSLINVTKPTYYQ